MNYTQWLTKLIAIICQSGELTPIEIALSEDDCKAYFANGLTPEQVYFDIWEEDAGHLFAI